MDTDFSTKDYLPSLLGTFFSCILLGHLTSLYIRFVSLYPSKRTLRTSSLHLRLLVTCLLLLEIFHTSVQVSKRCKSFGNPAKLFSRDIEDLLSIFLNVLILAISQSFILQRFFIFAKMNSNSLNIKRWFLHLHLTVLGTGILGGFVFGCISVSQLAKINTLQQLMTSDGHIFRLFARLWLIVTATVDVLISGMLIYELNVTKKNLKRMKPVENNNDATSKLLTGLLLFAINSGVLVLATQMWTTVAWAKELSSNGGATWGYFPLAFLSKCYSITVIYYLIASRSTHASNQMICPTGNPHNTSDIENRKDEFSPWTSNSMSTLIGPRLGYSLTKQNSPTTPSNTKRPSLNVPRVSSSAPRHSMTRTSISSSTAHNDNANYGRLSGFFPNALIPLHHHHQQNAHSRPGTSDSQLTKVARPSTAESDSGKTLRPGTGDSQRSRKSKSLRPSTGDSQRTVMGPQALEPISEMSEKSSNVDLRKGSGAGVGSLVRNSSGDSVMGTMESPKSPLTMPLESTNTSVRVFYHDDEDVRTVSRSGSDRRESREGTIDSIELGEMRSEEFQRRETRESPISMSVSLSEDPHALVHSPDPLSQDLHERILSSKWSATTPSHTSHARRSWSASQSYVPQQPFEQILSSKWSDTTQSHSHHHQLQKSTWSFSTTSNSTGDVSSSTPSARTPSTQSTRLQSPESSPNVSVDLGRGRGNDVQVSFLNVETATINSQHSSIPPPRLISDQEVPVRNHSSFLNMAPSLESLRTTGGRPRWSGSGFSVALGLEDRRDSSKSYVGDRKASDASFFSAISQQEDSYRSPQSPKSL